MILSDEEKKMLHGNYGHSVAMAMDYLVKLGEACDATSMIDIDYAHVNAGEAVYINDIEEILNLAKTGAKVRVPTTTNIVPIDMDQWQIMGTPEDLAEKQLQVHAAHKAMGVAGTYTCTPYLSGYLPVKNSHISSTETPAIIYFNSMLGARTNRDGTFPIFSAITGKYPACGYHLDENRKGTHLVHVETLLSGPTEYGALGYYIGELVGDGAPVITGLRSPRQEEIISMGAALSTSGAVALYHIPGVTAECQDVDSTLNGDISDEFSVSEFNIKYVFDKLRTTQKDTIDFVFLGCPHYGLEQIRYVTGLLDGKRISETVTLWVATNRALRAVANQMGYADIIRRAGGMLISDCCGSMSHLRKSIRNNYGLSVPGVRAMLTDSVKQAKYAKDTIGCTTVVANVEQCIKSAITGKLEN
ncbi:aconitase X [Chloroflexota bacterium]